MPKKKYDFRDIGSHLTRQGNKNTIVLDNDMPSRKVASLAKDESVILDISSFDVRRLPPEISADILTFDRRLVATRIRSVGNVFAPNAEVVKLRRVRTIDNVISPLGLVIIPSVKAFGTIVAGDLPRIAKDAQGIAICTTNPNDPQKSQQLRRRVRSLRYCD